MLSSLIFVSYLMPFVCIYAANLERSLFRERNTQILKTGDNGISRYTGSFRETPASQSGHEYKRQVTKRNGRIGKPTSYQFLSQYTSLFQYFCKYRAGIIRSYVKLVFFSLLLIRKTS